MENTTQPTQQSSGSGKKVLAIIAIIVLVLLIAGGWAIKKAVSGLGKTAVEKGLEKATGGKVDVDNNKVTVKGEHGETVTFGDQKLPSDWPSDVPVYGGAKISFSGSATNDEGKQGAQVILSTDDSVQKVSDYYRKELVDKGWTMKGSANASTGSTLAYEKGDQALAIVIAGSQNTTSITLVVANK